MKDQYASKGTRGIGGSARSKEDEEIYSILKKALPHDARQEEQGLRPVEDMTASQKEEVKENEDDGFFTAMKSLFQRRKDDADQAAASASGKELKKATRALGQGAAMMGAANRANQRSGYTPMVGRAPSGAQASMDALRAQLARSQGRGGGTLSQSVGGGMMPFAFSDKESKMKAHMLDSIISQKASSQDSVVRKAQRQQHPLDDLMSETKPYSFDYNNKGRKLQAALGNDPDGRQYGVMAQDLERSPVGRSMVVDTPAGKVVDTNKAAMASLAANARLNERLERMEAGMARPYAATRQAEEEQLGALGPNIEAGLRDAFMEAMADLEKKKGSRRAR